MRPSPVTALLLVALVAPTASRAAETPLTLPDVPRVAFVGNTLVERDVRHGYLETLLINAAPSQVNSGVRRKQQL